MAELSNKARVGEAFDLLAGGIEPFVAQHMQRATPNGKDWAAHFVATSRTPDREYSTSDPSFLLNVMIEYCSDLIDTELGQDEWARRTARLLETALERFHIDIHAAGPQQA